MTYKIIASGSTGNAVLYHGFVLVDCGVSFSALKEDLQSIQVVLLTHEHADHFNLKTIERLAFERPSIQFVCGDHLADKLKTIKNVSIIEANKWYTLGSIKIAAIQLYHDVTNFGWRIEHQGHKTIHCTDTATLEGITAMHYDLYALEHNYNEDTVWQSIEAIESNGGYAHQRGSINSHLSEQQARQFFFENKGKNSELIRLHESKHY